MIYLDHGATSWPKPEAVRRGVNCAMERLGNPGRGGYSLSMEAAKAVYDARKTAADLFSCPPERVVFTSSCTHGLNMAIGSLISPGDRVVVSGFEHNAVTRTLYGLGAEIITAGRRLFDWEDTLREFRRALSMGVKAAVFTHVSNVFGYILPVEQMAALCREHGVPFILDAAQSAGHIPLDFTALGADFIAMPGHKGLLGPMGTGLLLCGALPEPIFRGGTGSQSMDREMPEFLPDRAEAGTLNVPGICGLARGMELVGRMDPAITGRREAALAKAAGEGLDALGLRVFRGDCQSGVLSFLPRDGDCETLAQRLGEMGICVRAGLHCAPSAHESAGTLETGTVRLSFGYGSGLGDVRRFLSAVERLSREK